MKKIWLKLSAMIIAVAIIAPVGVMAQKDEKSEKADKGVKEKKEVRQIIITNKGDKDEKLVIEINGDKVTVNGKPVEDFKDGEVSVRLNKLKDMEALSLTRTPRGGVWNYSDNEGYPFFNADANHAMLGVTTEENAGGAKVNSITKESAAEKAGLKEGDIITKVDDKKIASPDDLSKAIRDHKPGDKVKVTYMRDKKENTVSAELTKWKGLTGFSSVPGQQFDFKMEGMDNWDKTLPKVQGIPRVRSPYGLFNTAGTPKLGLSVQDADDGKGVTVIEVDEESNAAKAGIKNDDVIMEVDGKAVNGTDAMVKVIKESKDKNSIMVKLLRKGKTQNIEVKMPRKLKTADL